ncbi:MAG: c-type cytochrome biogenesis protein CcmI [Magnetospirillum sp.]|nr:MAG: c-type cytochrome biogenesis protein CcmI [Magnetospirillum sp.]
MIWIVFAVMLALALAGLLRPLLRPVAVGAARVEYDLAVYRDQLDEIARDVERDLLSAGQAEAARTEIQRRMLAAGESEKTIQPIRIKAGKRAAVTIALAMPLAALGFYLALGAPELPDRPYAGRAGQIAEMRQKVNTIQAMVDRLAERLKADPTDGKGWSMLGRSYRALGKIEEAKDAYAKAVKLLPGEVQARIEYAILLLDESETDTMPPEVVGLMGEVLAIDPGQPDALYFLGLDAAAKGDKARARKLWSRLLDKLPADSPARTQVQQQLDGLKP